ncbi:hypothetical protein EIP91_003633 [Steccherinum ochraceum]|uniref:NADP-dependent oxidoreductase domain-containing protein n=1 Tax=Steccherinum ochraceum TaxID=92696 RepID=A0A4R0RDI7_9APHY|nr:hypothetical protein EIP91_003633 [Steccherinum ochraceum]
MSSTAVARKRMPYVRLGNSGLKVSKLILGTMSYGSKQWQDWVISDQEEVNKQIKFAYDAGIQTFDSADFYSNGLSEIMLGKAIRELQLPREEVVLITKLWAPVSKDYGTNILYTGKTPEEFGVINQYGLNRKHIFDAVKASLERLQVDYIDVLFCHRFDKNTPIEETMHALHDVVKAGHVRYIGMSSCYAYQFHQMQNYAITHNLTPFIVMQNHYNLAYREEEREMLPTLKLFGVGSTPWSPLARGFLTRPLREQSVRAGSDPLFQFYGNTPGGQEINKRVEELAQKKGVSMAQIAVAWTLSKPEVSAPVIGSTSLKNLEDIIGGVDVTLSEEEIKYLEEPYKPNKIFGHF